MVQIQNQPVVTVSIELFSKVFNVGPVRVSGVLAKSFNLVSCIGYVASHKVLEEVEIYDNGAVVEPMVKRRRCQILLENHARFG